jgi:DNA-binding response OmpR family regulator
MAKKILVIEDDENLRSVLNDSLAKEGYSTLEAKNGEQGLELALSEHPDLILLDIILPDLNGIDMLKQIRGDEAWGQSAKVIMLTNLSDSQSVAACLDLGAHSFLVKSDWQIQDILKVIQDELAGQPRLRRRA